MYLSFFFIACVLIHATEEFTKGLAPYLEEAIGFKTGRWLDFTLLLLALSIILLPFVLVGTIGVNLDLAKSFVIGGLLGDALSTHWIPSLLRKKVCPGSVSVITYPVLAFVIFQFVAFSPIAFTLGILAFVSLWPSLLFVRLLLKNKSTK